MASREMATHFGADTSSFEEGVNKVKAKLIELSKSLLDNQAEIKKNNKEIKEFEKEQTELQKSMKSTKEAEDEQKKKLKELEEAMSKSKEATEEQKEEYEKLQKQLKETQSTLETQKKKYADITDALGNAQTRAAELRAEQAKLKIETKSATSELDAMYKATDNSSEGFTVLKGAISNLVSDALNVAIDKFKEMSVSAEQSLNSLQVKTGMSAEAVGELKDEMFDLYKNNYGDSLNDVADKMALVVQNIDESNPQKIKEITENAIGLSDAFGSDFEENLRGINGLMTNMGLTADEAFDLIAKGSQNGLDKTHELTDNLAEYTQLWGQAGFSAEEMFSILQNGLDSGAYTLDKVNDLVGEMSRSIIDGRLAENIDSFSDKTAQIFESFKSGRATQREVFDSMIDDLNNTSNLAEKLATSSSTWSALGEDNAMSVITALNNVNDTYKDVEGTMQEINDIQYNDIGSQISALGRQFEVDILQPIVKQASPQIKEFIDWVSNNLPMVTSSLAALVAGVTTFKVASAGGEFVKTMVLGFKSIKPAIEGATVAQEANNMAVKANFYVALASAILSAVAAITTWIVTNNNAASSMKNATSDVKDYAKAIRDAKSAAEEKEKSAEGEISLLQTQKERYDELRKKVNLTKEEQNELNNIASDLAKTLGTTTNALKDQSGAYKDLTGSVKDYIEQLRIKLQIENTEDVLKEAYAAKSKTERELKEINKEIEAAKQAVGGFNGYQLIEDNEQNRNAASAAGYSVSQLNSMVATWSNLTVQHSNAESAIEEYEGELRKLQGEQENINGEIGNTNNGLKSQTDEVKNLSEAMSEMSAKTTAITNAEEEYNKSGKLTASTLQEIINKYPALENEVYNYMLNLTDAKTLINSMKNVYQNDLNAYISVIAQKASDSNTFYNQLINANSAFVNDAKVKYGIDLMNFKNLQEAKAKMLELETKKVESSLNPLAGFDSFKSGMGANSGILSNSFSKTISGYSSKIAESIVSNFIGSSLSAGTNYQDFFKTGNSGGKSGGGDVSSAAAEASKAEDALLKKYELAEAAYNRLVDKRIEKIQKEQEAREKAKEAEIAAIDEEIEARKRLTEDRDLQKELNEVNAQLRYSQLDTSSRRELERKRQDILNEQAEIWWQRRMSDKKDSIESSYNSYKNGSDTAITALQRAANSAAEYFDELKNGYKSNTQIVNNNSDTRNIQIIANALSNQQMLDKLLNAIYSK